MYPEIEIKLPKLNNATFTYVSSTGNSNVSNPSQVFATRSSIQVAPGFQLSAYGVTYSDLSGKYALFGSAGYAGFLSNTFMTADSSITFTAQISTVSLAALYIIFDLATQEYASSFTLTNVSKSKAIQVTNSDVIANVDVTALDISNGNTLRLSGITWSVPSKTFKVVAITTGISIKITGSSIINFKCSENMMASDLRIEAGICEQYLDASLYDRDGLLHQLYVGGQLDEDCEIIVRVINNNTSTTIGTYLASEWRFNSSDSILDIAGRDKTYLLSKINAVRSDAEDRTVHGLLTILFNNAPDMSWSYLDAATSNRCANILIPNSWYASNDLSQLLDKICAVGMLRIFWYIDRFYVGSVSDGFTA